MHFGTTEIASQQSEGYPNFANVDGCNPSTHGSSKGFVVTFGKDGVFKIIDNDAEQFSRKIGGQGLSDDLEGN